MLNWYRQVDDARSIERVIAVVRDYFATWTPEELALLPPHCRPGRMKTEQDVDEMHRLLVEEYRRSDAQDDALSALQRLTSVLVRASVRVAQLTEDRDSPPEPPEGDPKRSAAPRERN